MPSKGQNPRPGVQRHADYPEYPAITKPMASIGATVILLISAGHGLIAGLLMIVLFVGVVGAGVWSWMSNNAWTHTDAYRQERLKGWILKELPSPCETVGHEYTLDPQHCDWCGVDRSATMAYHSRYGTTLAQAKAARRARTGQRYNAPTSPRRAAWSSEAATVGDAPQGDSGEPELVYVVGSSEPVAIHLQRTPPDTGQRSHA